jgi:hypothetical protein
MPRIKVHAAASFVKGELARQLAAELKNGRDCGQPMIYEQEYSTGKLRVIVIWDEWAGVPLEDRSATIVRAYEQAEGAEYRDRIALASGLTVPEAHAAGMLPFQIIAARRPTDPVTEEQVRKAMLDEGASVLADPPTPRLRFSSNEQAEACRQRLIKRLPGSDPVWIINQEAGEQDQLIWSGSFGAEVG